MKKSREQSRDLVFERSKAVTPDQMEVLEILGKRDQSGHRSPSECQKQRDFQGGLDFDEKGGGGRGGSKMQNPPGKTRFKVVKGGPFGAHFGPNRASLGAFEFILIESERESDQKRPLRAR